MWFRPTLEVERDHVFRCGAVPERRPDRFEGHAATPFAASPHHASGHSTAMAARQSLDLETQACTLVSHSAPERPLRRHPVLLSTHRPIGLEAIGERPAIANRQLESSRRVAAFVATLSPRARPETTRVVATVATPPLEPTNLARLIEQLRAEGARLQHQENALPIRPTHWQQVDRLSPPLESPAALSANKRKR